MAAVTDPPYRTLLKAFVTRGAFGFVFGAHAAGDGFARGKFGAADLAFFFQLLLRLGAKTRPGDGFEAFGFDGFAGQFAHAVSAAADAHHGFVNFVDGVLFGGDAAQREIAIKAVGAGIGHVQAERGLLFPGVFHEIVLAIEEVVARFAEAAIVFLPFLGHASRALSCAAISEDIRRRGAGAAGWLLRSFYCHGISWHRRGRNQLPANLIGMGQGTQWKYLAGNVEHRTVNSDPRRSWKIKIAYRHNWRLLVSGVLPNLILKPQRLTARLHFNRQTKEPIESCAQISGNVPSDVDFRRRLFISDASSGSAIEI